MQKVYTVEKFFFHILQKFCTFFAKKKRIKGCLSLIVQLLLENNINQKMGTSCPNPKSICKNFAKIVKKNCKKKFVKN